jgi:ABC-type sugar transport system substrate-binding protein
LKAEAHVKQLVSFCSIFCMLLMLAAGCGSGDETAVSGGGSTTAPSASGASKAGQKITVAMLPKQKGIPYFTSCATGAQEAAKELGNVEVIYDGPTSGKAEESASMIEQWTLQGVDVIAVSPNDPAILAPAMKAAREKGVHVITWDADGQPDTREWFINQATAQAIGYALVDTMAKDLGGDNASGDVAIITASLTAANQNEWMKHMKERLASKYPNLKLVDVKPAGEDQLLGKQIAQDFIKAYPNLKGIFAISSAVFPGAAEGIKAAGKSGEVLVTGLATPNDMKAYVKDGTVKSVVLWDTAALGKLTIYAARAVVDGKLKPGDKTFDAGPLGEKKIDGSSILLGDYLDFTKDNIDKYDF